MFAKLANRWGLLALLTLIVGAHVALWISDSMTRAEKLNLTLTNALIWAVLLIPAIGVNFWVKARLRAKAEAERGDDG